MIDHLGDLLNIISSRSSGLLLPDAIQELHHATDQIQSVPTSMQMSDAALLAQIVDLVVKELQCPPAHVFSGLGGTPCEPDQQLQELGRTPLIKCTWMSMLPCRSLHCL
jgi:hypothetical protein